MAESQGVARLREMDGLRSQRNQLRIENDRLRSALTKFVEAFGECTEIPPKDKGHKVITAWLEAKEVLRAD